MSLDEGVRIKRREAFEQRQEQRWEKQEWREAHI